MDTAGLRIAPLVVLAAAAAVTAVVWRGLRRSAVSDPPVAASFAVVVGGVLGYLVYLAPSLLPPGTGVDLTHHLVLVDYIEQHWRLPHDPALGPALAEMYNYTAGLHLFSALLGAWMLTDGLHAIYVFIALTVALKAGVVFLLALRLLSRDVPRIPLAIVAVLLLPVPFGYFIGSFANESYLAQVASEYFAVVMMWAVVAWNDDPGARTALTFAIAGIGVFLTWPVWIGPLLLMLAAVMVTKRELPMRVRLESLAAACVPIAIVVTVYVVGRTDAVMIVASGGYVPYPTVDSFGRWFLLCGAVGLVIAAAHRRSRSVVWLVLAIAVQAAALYVVARRAGADRPYMALKMVYLGIYPIAVAGAVGLAAAWRLAARGARATAWVLPVAIGVLVVRALAATPRPKPVITHAMDEAAQWTRAHLPADCIDYLVGNDYSSYWLHHAALGNPRSGGRPHGDDLYDAKKAVARWIFPGGRPYAIAADFNALPREIREQVDVLARFGPAAVIQRRGRSSCD